MTRAGRRQTKPVPGDLCRDERLERGEQSLPGLVHRRANDIPNTGQDATLVIVLTTRTHTHTQPALRSSKHTDSREKIPENIQNKTRVWSWGRSLF